jgi:hypothetical protein
MTYLFGMILPFAFFLLILVLLWGKKSAPIVYDERQTVIRGNAYKYATITGVIGGFIAAFLIDLNLLPMNGSFALMTISLVMVTVYIVYMVIKGVYFGISDQWKKWTALVFVIGLCNTITGVLRIYEDGLPEGKLTIVNIPVLMGPMFMVIATVVLFQKMKEKESADH